jgi:hypothetical protein
MQLVHQSKEAAGGPIHAASLQVSNPFTLTGEHPDCTEDSALLQVLRRQLARHGLSAFSLCGSELLVSGPGVSHVAPDVRGAWAVLRALEGRFA